MTTSDAPRLPDKGARLDEPREVGPEVVVEESELSRIEGERLYTLSPFAGLSVSDISKPKPALLGRRHERGTPAGMYVHGDRVFALFTDSGQDVEDADAEMTRWALMNRLVVLDISDLGAIKALDEITFAGKLVDSRARGDNVYVVTDEDGACFRCAETLRTLVTAFHVSNEGDIEEAGQLSYDFKEGSNHSSVVAAGKQHLYVVPWEYPWVDETQRSTIEVIDVADPGGALAAGRGITAGGVVWNRWQMDERAGVLRVATGSVVETFEVATTDETPPLAVLTLDFPSETVRFDGARAYVSGNAHFSVLDLADPASPKELGALELETSIDYLEPHGDRVVALRGPGWPRSLMLLDVADPTVPRALDAVTFEVGEPPYFRDPRIHQALSFNEGDGFIAVPLIGSLDGADVCQLDTSAMALVEWSADKLTVRSEVGTRGTAGRAFLHAGRLYSASAERVEVFDIDDPEKPTELGSVSLYQGAGQMIRVRDHLVRISDDWSEAPTLEVTSVEKLESSEPGPRLLLAEPDACSNRGRYGSAQLFAHEDLLFMIRRDYGEESWDYVLEVFRIGDGVPEFVSSMSLPPGDYCVRDAFADGASCSMGAVQIATTLVIPSVPGPDFFEADPVSTTYQLQVLDLSDPENPRHVRTIERGAASGVGPLELVGSLVVGSRWVEGDDPGTELRFYVDRFDFSDPQNPVDLCPINVPGALLNYDAERSRIATLDYQLEKHSDLDKSECPKDLLAFRWWKGACWQLEETVNLLELKDSGVELLDSVTLPNETIVSAADVNRDRIFLAGNQAFVGDSGVLEGPSKLLHLSGMSGKKLKLRSIELPVTGISGVLAHGSSALLYSRFREPRALVVDMSDPEEAQIVHNVQLPGDVAHVLIEDDRAICALGAFGTTIVPLR